MMKPARLTSQGARRLDQGLREVADSPGGRPRARRTRPVLVLAHLVLGALLLARLTLAVLGGRPGGPSGSLKVTASAPTRGRRRARRGPALGHLDLDRDEEHFYAMTPLEAELFGSAILVLGFAGAL